MYLDKANNVTYMAGGKHMYDNKTNEELIELLEERDERVDQLEASLEECDNLYHANSALQQEIDEHDASLADREEVSEKAFYAGYNKGYSDCKLVVTSTNTPKGVLKHWLNYKMMERIS